jgi:hypothetical protein
MIRHKRKEKGNSPFPDDCPDIRSSYQITTRALAHLPEVKSGIVNPRKLMFFLLLYLFFQAIYGFFPLDVD